MPMTSASRTPLHSRPLHQRLLLAALLLGSAATSTSLQADEGGRGQRVPLLPAYQQECAACHIAYPPGLLPAASWRRVMDGLPHHFGTDASLDAATVQQIAGWLGANAATGRRASPPPPEDRITRSAWFVREHDEVPAATWKRAAIKSAANCAACHTRADQGDFSERNIRIPR